MSLVHKNITISGKVQGVYFRASAKHIADRLQVKGIVRNDPDGKVFAEAEGEQEAVNSFINWCSTGPPSAGVTDISVTEGRLKGYQSFEVLR